MNLPLGARSDMKLVTVPEMVTIEMEADARGLTYAQMMENAGTGLAEIIHDLQAHIDIREVLGLVGPGNNGGDTLVALSLLAASGWRARAYLVNRRQDALVERLQTAGGHAIQAVEDQDFAGLSSLMASAGIMLDGLLGTGSRPPVRGVVANVMSQAKRVLHGLDGPPYVIAVDCPSGVDCDTGEASDDCIRAELTVTMAAVKQGLLRMPAHNFVGDLRVVDIGLPADLPSLESIRMQVADEELVAGMLPSRPPDAHKGTFGTAMIAAGSVNYTGAAFLAGSAAYRAGAGLVTLAVPSLLHAVLAGRLPEATWLLLPHEVGVISRDASAVLLRALTGASALLVGPGLGTEDTTREFIARLLARGRTVSKATAPMGLIDAKAGRGIESGEALPGLVFDADGLKLLAGIQDWPRLLPGTAVLTPHPGEMSVLTGISKEDIQQQRAGIAARFAKAWGHVVVLKGAFTVVAAPQGQIAIIPVASAALARAGSGDVLAGIIVGLRAQGVAPYDAAVAGAWIHAEAGLYAATRLGNTASVLAGDILESVTEVISDLPGS